MLQRNAASGEAFDDYHGFRLSLIRQLLHDFE
jgi:hypothetical protein